MTTASTTARRLEVLRDEALNTAEYGPDALGAEIFDAVINRLETLGDTDPGLDMRLHDSLSRRLAWGENPSTVIVDCAMVSRRLIAAAQRSFVDPEEASRVVAITCEVSCAAARHLARFAVQGASNERAQQRRELMVQRQLGAALKQQDELLKTYRNELV